jgi:hypothetical protein
MRTTRCPEVVPKECSAHNSKLGWAASFFGTQDQDACPLFGVLAVLSMKLIFARMAPGLYPCLLKNATWLLLM